MIPIIPIFVGLLHVVTSQTEQIDFSNIAKSNINGDKIVTGVVDVPVNNYSGLKAFLTDSQKLNSNDDDEWKKLGKRRNPLKIDKIMADDYESIIDNAFKDFDDDTEQIEAFTETELNRLSIFLTKFLQHPEWTPPLILIDEVPFAEGKDDLEILTDSLKRSKKSRFYMPYPGKRQQSKYNYDYDTTVDCVPTRGDIHYLIGAVHFMRRGEKLKYIHFCTRRSTPGTLFTKLRFLGRRK